MPARSFVLALLLLLGATPIGRAAEPAGPTVVLQLPPSMSPEAVRGLIADLAAEGAQPAAASREWSVTKFNLHLDPAADIETVRKTVKRVGEELLDDPEIGADFIQLKMQGVVDVLQTALVVRCKFTATPPRPT